MSVLGFPGSRCIPAERVEADIADTLEVAGIIKPGL
jgi:hypothetical protein